MVGRLCIVLGDRREGGVVILECENVEDGRYLGVLWLLMEVFLGRGNNE